MQAPGGIVCIFFATVCFAVEANLFVRHDITEHMLAHLLCQCVMLHLSIHNALVGVY